MTNARRAAAIGIAVTLLAVPRAALAERRIAVLEFRAPGATGCATAAGELSARCQLVTTLSDSARSGALAAFKQAGDKSFVVMTREATAVMLKDMGRSLCTAEGECEVEVGRSIGADLVVSGQVAVFGDTYLVTLKLHETTRATLLETREVEASKELEAVRAVRTATTALVANGLGLREEPRGGPEAADSPRRAYTTVEPTSPPLAPPPAPASLQAAVPPAIAAPAAPSIAPAAPTAGPGRSPLSPSRDRRFYLAARAGAFAPRGKDLPKSEPRLDLEAAAGLALGPVLAAEMAVGRFGANVPQRDPRVSGPLAPESSVEEADLDVVAVTATLRARAPLRGPLAAYGLGGVGKYSAELRRKWFGVASGNVVNDTVHDSPFAFHLGGGVEWAVSRQLRIGLEAKYAFIAVSYGTERFDLGGFRAGAALLLSL